MPDYTHDAPLTSKGSVTDEEWGLGSSGRADSQDTSSKTGAGFSTASLISTNTREGSTIAQSLAHSVSADLGQVAARASDCLGDGIVGVGEAQPWQSDPSLDCGSPRSADSSDGGSEGSGMTSVSQRVIAPTSSPPAGRHGELSVWLSWGGGRLQCRQAGDLHMWLIRH